MSRTAPTREERKPGGPRPRPNLKLLRKRMELGLSRDDLGRLAGCSGKQVGLIERGVVRRPREMTMAGIAEAMRVPTLDLFDEWDRIA